MKKLLLVLLASISLTAMAQTTPNWYGDNQRTVNYPKSQYFVGIAYGEVKRNEALGAAMERMKTAARVEALSTITMHVQNETRSHLHNETLESIDAWSEEIKETYDSHTTTNIDLEIPGLQVEAWKNPDNNEVVGFAYIKKSTLSRQMDKQITIGLTRIETTLENVQQLISNGQKMEAKEVLKKAAPQFLEVEKAQRVLMASDPMSDAESLQLAETKQLTQRYMQLVRELKNGINIYLSCTADMFGTNYAALKAEIQGELSKLGCTFVNSAAQSDWAIYVTAPAREYRKTDYESNSSYFSYVDANIIVDKTTTGQRIFEDQISEKGGHTMNYEQAARDAYKQISPQISTIIKRQIMQ